MAGRNPPDPSCLRDLSCLGDVAWGDVASRGGRRLLPRRVDARVLHRSRRSRPTGESSARCWRAPTGGGARRARHLPHGGRAGGAVDARARRAPPLGAADGRPARPDRRAPALGSRADAGRPHHPDRARHQRPRARRGVRRARRRAVRVGVGAPEGRRAAGSAHRRAVARICAAASSTGIRPVRFGARDALRRAHARAGCGGAPAGVDRRASTPTRSSRRSPRPSRSSAT